MYPTMQILQISLWSYWRFSLFREDLNEILLYLRYFYYSPTITLSWYFSSEEFSWRSLEIGMNVRGSFWFVEGVASLVSLPHPVDDEHDEEDGAQQADHGPPYNSCKIVWRYKRVTNTTRNGKRGTSQPFRYTPVSIPGWAKKLVSWL